MTNGTSGVFATVRITRPGGQVDGCVDERGHDSQTAYRQPDALGRVRWITDFLREPAHAP